MASGYCRLHSWWYAGHWASQLAALAATISPLMPQRLRCWGPRLSYAVLRYWLKIDIAYASLMYFIDTLYCHDIYWPLAATGWHLLADTADADNTLPAASWLILRPWRYAYALLAGHCWLATQRLASWPQLIHSHLSDADGHSFLTILSDTHTHRPGHNIEYCHCHMTSATYTHMLIISFFSLIQYTYAEYCWYDCTDWVFAIDYAFAFRQLFTCFHFHWWWPLQPLRLLLIHDTYGCHMLATILLPQPADAITTQYYYCWLFTISWPLPAFFH